MAGIPGDGTTWELNGSQFIRAKRGGNTAFYGLSVGLDDEALQFTLVVSLIRKTFHSDYTST